MPRALLISSVLLLLAGSVCAQQRGIIREDDWYPLGGLGAEGLVETVDKDEGVLIKGLDPDGPATRGGLRIGDLIIGAEGKKLTGKTEDELVDMLCELIEKAEAGKPKGGKLAPLDLIVVRDGKKEKVTVGVRAYPAFHRSDITRCKKTEQILNDALEFLARDQQGDGRPGHVANENHAVATASLSGLAWLGADRKKYARNIEAAAEFVMKQAGNERDFGGMRTVGEKKANWNQTNWALGYGSIFLAEYVAQKKKQSVRVRLAEIIKKLEENQEQSGGWAHGPGGPNALGYLELEIMSNFALGGMGMAERVGVEVDRAKVIRAYEWIKTCTSGGGVAYSPQPGQAGMGDPGRTAGALWAVIQAGRAGDLSASMTKFYERGLEKLYEGHACPTMHLLNGALASALGGKKDFADYWKVYRPFLMSLRRSHGSFGYRPTAESRQMKHHPDRSWGPAFATAHFAIIMQLAQGRYELLDTPRSAN